MFYGNFEVKLHSDYEYKRGTVVEILGVRYEVVKEIIDAVSPILQREVETIKKEIGKDVQ